MTASAPVAAEARANRVSRPIGDVAGREDLFERDQALACHGLADVRMVEHDEVVPRAEILDGVRLEAFERLLLPVDRNPVL